jgi:hypothetical protein
MPLTVGVQLSERDRNELVSWTRSPSMKAGLAQQARVVLLAADGVGTCEIVRRVGLSKPVGPAPVDDPGLLTGREVVADHVQIPAGNRARSCSRKPRNSVQRLRSRSRWNICQVARSRAANICRTPPVRLKRGCQLWPHSGPGTSPTGRGCRFSELPQLAAEKRGHDLCAGAARRSPQVSGSRSTMTATAPATSPAFRWADQALAGRFVPGPRRRMVTRCWWVVGRACSSAPSRMKPASAINWRSSPPGWPSLVR